MSLNQHDLLLQLTPYPYIRYICRRDRRGSVNTRYAHVSRLGGFFRNLQEDPKVSELLLSPLGTDTQTEASNVPGEVYHKKQERQGERGFRQFSSAQELRTLFLQQVIKTFSVDYKRNAMATNKSDRSASIYQALSLLKLSMTADGNDVVPKDAVVTHERKKSLKTYTIPRSLRGVHFLSQPMHHWFIQAIGYVNYCICMMK